LIALIINAHPKIDEHDVELFSQNQCLSLACAKHRHRR
jgi:hypothetical protein